MAYMLKKSKWRASMTTQLPIRDLSEYVTTQLPVRDLSKYVNYNKDVASKIRFSDTGWADSGRSENGMMSINGYIRNERFQYQRSDLWFALIPALYLLVPGSGVWRVGFFSIVDTAAPGAATGDFSMQTLIFGVFVIGIGQVIGVRLALATLWAVREIWLWKRGALVDNETHAPHSSAGEIEQQDKEAKSNVPHVSDTEEQLSEYACCISMTEVKN
jgi:hypothetical protein